jgi:hypothetical protein
MAEPNEAAIEKRAKELAERDGYAWELEFKPVVRYAPIRLKRLLVNEDRRQEYIARARAELQRKLGAFAT